MHAIRVAAVNSLVVPCLAIRFAGIGDRVNSFSDSWAALETFTDKDTPVVMADVIAVPSKLAIADATVVAVLREHVAAEAARLAMQDRQLDRETVWLRHIKCRTIEWPGEIGRVKAESVHVTPSRRHNIVRIKNTI